MMMARHLAGTAALAMLTALAWSAAAWSQPQPQATAPPTFGPPLAGVCLFGREQALGQSRAGVSANQQLSQFQQGIEAELKAERDTIARDDQALLAQKPSLPAADYQQRVTQLRQRYDVLQRTTQTRAAQLTRTRNDAITQIATAMAPSLNETITARRCSLVIEKGGVYGANPAMDITPQVIGLMNTRLPSVTLRLAALETTPAR
jgi:Skp family chaperone for outer membrane proteins